MQYANTVLINGVETVVTVLPLDFVPGFNPDSPSQPNTYAANSNVQVGWIRQNGTFIAPPPA